MDLSGESRLELKAAVTRAQHKLVNEFPLQARIEGAPPALQAAYAAILGHWIREAAPPVLSAGIARLPQVRLPFLCHKRPRWAMPFSHSRGGCSATMAHELTKATEGDPASVKE